MSTVVNDHVAGVVIAVPVSLLALRVTVYVVEPLSAAVGVKVVVREVGS